MSGTPRDLIKTAEARRGEILTLQHLKAGQANGQAVLFGGDITVHTDTDEFALSATYYAIAGQTLSKAVQTDIEVASGATTGAGEFRKVLIEINASGTVSQKVGTAAAAQADAVLPKGDTDKVSLGWLELPASFTAGTTALTSGMIKKMPYFGQS